VIIVTGHVRLAPENMERARPHMRKVLEATREEPGCLVYAYGEDVLDPGLVRIVERWRDWPSLEAHGKTPHIDAWRAALKEIGVLDREVIAHESGEERIL
jgi:quinol monooxygenase YgiN